LRVGINIMVNKKKRKEVKKIYDIQNRVKKKVRKI
jgi:hypothetical protein